MKILILVVVLNFLFLNSNGNAGQADASKNAVRSTCQRTFGSGGPAFSVCVIQAGAGQCSDVAGYCHAYQNLAMANISDCMDYVESQMGITCLFN